MKFTVKELMAAEPQMVEVIKVLVRKMMILNDLQQESMETVIEFPIIPDAPEHPKLVFKIKKSPLRTLGIDVKEQITATVNILARLPCVFKMEKEDIERGYCKEEDIERISKAYLRELAMGMSTHWLNESGYLAQAMEYLDNDEIQELRNQFDGMIDIHYNDTGASIALLSSRGEPIATEAKFAKVDIDGFNFSTKEKFKEFVKQKLPNYIRYGWAFSGHYEIWKSPITKPVEEI